jgi:microcystin-dependent protein
MTTPVYNLAIGEIILLACGYAPAGMFLCDGRNLSTITDSYFYSVIRDQYTNSAQLHEFSLPNLKSPVTPASGPVPVFCMVYSGIYPRSS